jgi:hypothetical protein
MKTLLNWRKSQDVIHNGKLTHYIPQDNVYVYFRHNSSKTVMVVVNANGTEKTLDARKFAEIGSFTNATEIINQKDYATVESVRVEPMSGLVLELK